MTAAITTTNNSGNIAGAQATGTTITSLSHSTAVTQAGVYQITAYVVIGAAPGANDTNNVVVAVGSTTITVPVQPVAGMESQISFEATLDGTADVVMKVGANTSVAPYSGTLTAKFMGSIGGARR